MKVSQNLDREWKPGDVAFGRINKYEGRFVYRGEYDGWDEVDGHGGGWDGKYIEDLRPLVVIDPEDEDAAFRLIDLYFLGGADRFNARAMQAALREFANPKPPKPEEPTGLGAVVEDAEGRRYTRYHATSTTTEPQPWALEIDDDRVEIRYAYPDIDVVRVLSEGVEVESR